MRKPPGSGPRPVAPCTGSADPRKATRRWTCSSPPRSTRCTTWSPEAMAEPWILAVDLGTGGPKTGAVSLGGRLLAAAQRSVPTTYSDDGGAVQDPEAWWQGIREGVDEVLGSGVPAEEVIGVGITGQWGSTVPVGAGGVAAGPCMLWADTRGRSLAAARMGGRVNVVGYSPGNLVSWLRLTGGAPSPHGADPLGHHLHLRER